MNIELSSFALLILWVLLCYLIGTIGGKVLDIVDDVVEDKDEANKRKFQIQKKLMESKTTELEAQAKIVLAEAQVSSVIGDRY